MKNVFHIAVQNPCALDLSVSVIRISSGLYWRQINVPCGTGNFIL